MRLDAFKLENMTNLLPQTGDIAAKLLTWYDQHHRELPWRTSPTLLASGIKPDPYHIWLSEIMLQQTTVGAVKDYFMKFIHTWPNVIALAKADESDVLKAWAGLGYYSRARNLHKAARQVAFELDGVFPQSFEELIKLNGVGRYTAAAISSIAFNRAEPVVDGNVERVFTRLFAISMALPAAKPEIYEQVSRALSINRPGDFAQACMDLGATICSPKNPKCIQCPLRENCAGLSQGDPQIYPFKLAKALKPKRFGAGFVVINSEGAVLLNKRSDKGLLAGMSGIPTSDWDARRDGVTEISAAPFNANWEACGSIRHVFTHFELELFVFKTHISTSATYVQNDAEPMPGHWWSPPEKIASEALPTVMKKVVAAAVGEVFKKTKP